MCETYTDNWLPANAQTNMDNCLTTANNDVQAVLAENDGMAGGVIAALEAQGMKIPVSGQDGDNAALNRVAQGRQTVSVWKDSRDFGKAAGEAAIALAQGGNIADTPNLIEFTSPGGQTLQSVDLPTHPDHPGQRPTRRRGRQDLAGRTVRRRRRRDRPGLRRRTRDVAGGIDGPVAHLRAHRSSAPSRGQSRDGALDFSRPAQVDAG